MDKHSMMSLYSLALITLFLRYSSPASDFSNRVTEGQISSASGLHMVSGLAASKTHPGYLYAINDNAGSDKIYIVHADTAKVVGVLTVQHSHEFDWEDIAVGPCPRGSGACIFVADTGSQHHNQATVYAVKEPSTTHTQNVQVTSTYGYKWTEGSSEAMVVDSAGEVYMFSEHSGQPAHMAKLPSQNWDNGKVNTLHSTLTLPFKSANSGPLAADISPSGTDLLIKTLNHIYYWHMPGKSVVNALQHPGIGVPYVSESRGESVAWKWDGNGYYTIGQDSQQALHFYGRKVPIPSTRPSHTTPKLTHHTSTIQATSTPHHSVTPFPDTGYYNEFVEIGHIDSSKGLHMTSGLAASRKHPGYLYAINDNSHSASIYVVDEWTASVVATLHVMHASAADWEDIAVGPCPGYETCIYIADTGSGGNPTKNTVYKIKEPKDVKTQNINVEKTFHFTWSEGSSEALMVDRNGDVYILSEATGSGSKLAKLPRNGWGQGHPVTLSHLLTLPLQTSTLGPVAADISPSGQDLLIKTVNHVYHWHMEDGDVEKALQHPGEQVAYHTEGRGEAVAWNTDGNGYFTFGQTGNDVMYLFRHRANPICNWCN
ncbi:uncharacterized protein LOC124140820 isoform X2 [Haliotis rufescens]|uniref:uncharacterized protein LOC124140820 isoform X2 n=1 Tax=Haliotis rufescens TaxID=6454 RepID=UPI00201E9672|nr:uncharacterized protein LOC124140820 isoform X2 [Haliotis rufescens]